LFYYRQGKTDNFSRRSSRVEEVNLVAYCFQFFSRLAVVFAEQVGDFGIFEIAALSSGVQPALTFAFTSPPSAKSLFD
jgi:hypothetical protein